MLGLGGASETFLESGSDSLAVGNRRNKERNEILTTATLDERGLVQMSVKQRSGTQRCGGARPKN